MSIHRLDAFEYLLHQNRIHGPFSGRLRLMLDIDAHDGVDPLAHERTIRGSDVDDILTQETPHDR